MATKALEFRRFLDARRNGGFLPDDGAAVCAILHGRRLTLMPPAAFVLMRTQAGNEAS